MIDQQQTLAQLIKWCKAHYGASMGQSQNTHVPTAQPCVSGD